MCTHNICFCQEIRKISAFFGWKKKRLICCYVYFQDSSKNPVIRSTLPRFFPLLRVIQIYCIFPKYSFIFNSNHVHPKHRPQSIATDKMGRGGIHTIFFLFLYKNICCGYSLEAPHRGTSNEYPQHMFSWMKKAPYLLLCQLRKFSYLFMPLKIAWWVANSADPIQMPQTVTSEEWLYLKGYWSDTYSNLCVRLLLRWMYSMFYSLWRRREGC